MLLASGLFSRPITFLILVVGIGQREGIKMESAITPSANELKPMIRKKHISQEEWYLVLSLSDVAFTSVHSEKTRLKKLMMMMMMRIMNKSQETTFFSGRQKLTSAMKLRPEK